MVFLGCLLADVFFSNKLDAILEQRYFVFTLLSLLTFNSVLVSYFIADVFIRHALYFQYLFIASFVIGAGMMMLWIVHEFTLHTGLVTHFLIELGLLFSALFVRRYKTHAKCATSSH